MSATCTVCGFENSDKNPTLSESYKDNTYYFCCPLCQGTFRALPEHFISGKKVLG